MQSFTVRVAVLGIALLGGARLSRAQAQPPAEEQEPKPNADQASVADKLQNPGRRPDDRSAAEQL